VFESAGKPNYWGDRGNAFENKHALVCHLGPHSNPAGFSLHLTTKNWSEMHRVVDHSFFPTGRTTAPHRKIRSLHRVRFLHSQSNLIKNFKGCKEQESHCLRISTGIRQWWSLNSTTETRSHLQGSCIRFLESISSQEVNNISFTGEVGRCVCVFGKGAGTRAASFLGFACYHANVIKSIIWTHG